MVRSKEDFDVVRPLPKKNIDTGMGLERVAFLLQGKPNMYEIDVMLPVIEKAEEIIGGTYGANHDDDVRMRVVADYVRSGTTLIGDGVVLATRGAATCATAAAACGLVDAAARPTTTGRCWS